MFALDTPNVPPNLSSVGVVQIATTQRPTARVDRTIGVCGLVENPVKLIDDHNPDKGYSAVNGVDPIGAAMVYFQSIENKDVRLPGTITVIQRPQHGELKPVPQLPGEVGGFWYLPHEKYIGKDTAVFLVEVGGMKVKVHHFIRVLDSVPEDGYEDVKYCPKGDYWKISLSDPGVAPFLAGFVSPNSLPERRWLELTIRNMDAP